LAAGCNLQFGKRAVAVDVKNKTISFADGSVTSFQTLISTLPLNQMMAMTGFTGKVEPYPYSSVLVLNIGAVRGNRCPEDHWLYIPQSSAGFHRVGFYSNVDPSFLPAANRDTQNKVSIYIEKAYEGGSKPTEAEIDSYKQQVVKELQNWGFIEDVEVNDPTWIDVAYTWAWPNSNWKQWALEELAHHGIYQAGRYGRWTFNGIAASLIEGLTIGSAHKPK
jgi:protoporphyrinogen oxidase